ncbi:MAG: phosphate ABC transporter permease [Candidatus Rokubacteria bacterium 13_2_20CM_69_10]|nr:MAG: phosphate ABC transporter permease [Candidatus Rokubacteria bacterium 13_2_20CM_69_10]
MVDRVAEAAGPSHIVIRPSTGWTGVSLRDLWAYRELLYFLAWRDIKVRYKQTALGVIWVVIQPLFAMLVFSVFFGRLAGMPSGGVPYPVFAFCALLPWQLFAHALTESSASLVTNQNLITKVYFPRLIIPLAPVLASLLDFLIAFGLLLGMLAYYRITPTLWVWTLPLFLLLAIALAIGVGLWLAALNARYRDVRYTIPFLTQIWLFATPIAYPSSLVPEPWRAWYGLNPMAGVVDGFRWALLGTADAPGGLMAVSAAVTLVILVSGVHYFRRTERTFADTI